jgi:hypothetical protein
MREPNDTITPEKALWCAVFITYFEDMNYYIDLKNEVLASGSETFTLKNQKVDRSGVISKAEYLGLLDIRMRRLIRAASHPYTAETFEILGLDHTSFIDRLKWQYRNDIQLRLTEYEQRQAAKPLG